MLSLAACLDLEEEQLDVKTAFLHGDLDEKIFMRQLEGYVDKKYPEHVCFLKRSLYGLKQSPRLWYQKFDKFVLSLRFKRSEYNTCFYFASVADIPIYLLLYVDDMLLICKSMDIIKSLKEDLNSTFDMKDLGHAKRILGMIIERDRNSFSLKLHQRPYLEKLVSRFGDLNCKTVSLPFPAHSDLNKSQCPVTHSENVKMESFPYANAIGSIMYVMISTRPDLSYAISVLSRYMSNPGYEHWLAVKLLVAYIASTLDIGLSYSKRCNELDLIGYVDADFAREKDSRKSTTAYYFTFAKNCISWKSGLQSIVTLSTTESEYMVICDAFKDGIWLQGLVREAGLSNSVVTIFSDSESAIYLCKNPVFHGRTKHIDVRYHFIRDKVCEGAVKLLKIETENNTSDMGTKPVTVSKFKLCLDLLHIS
ncbi:unnamed protein product [Rhodiola kirilowii]